MAKYLLSNLAITDLTTIWNYTYDEWSEEQADVYYQQLINGFKRIAQQPNMG